MRLASVGVTLGLGIVALWLLEFGVLNWGGIGLLLFVSLMFFVGLSSAFSEVALSSYASNLPRALRMIDHRLELVGWLSLLNAIWLSGTLITITGEMVALRLFLHFLPSPWMMLAFRETSYFFLQPDYVHAVSLFSLWLIVAALTFVSKPERMVEVVMFITVILLALTVTLEAALPGGVNPGINFLVEGRCLGLPSPLIFALPVLGAGAGAGVLIQYARGESDAGFQVLLYLPIVVGIAFLALLAFLSGGGASGAIDATKYMLMPFTMLEVFSWWATSFATFSIHYGTLGGIITDIMVCLLTVLAALAVTFSLKAASTVIREEFRLDHRSALIVSTSPSVLMSTFFTLTGSWLQLVFLEWWFICVNLCLVALFEVLAVSWLSDTNRLLKELGLRVSQKKGRLLIVAFRFLATPLLAGVIISALILAWSQLYMFAPSFIFKDLPSTFLYLSLAWLAVCITTPLTLKYFAGRRRGNG